MNLYDSSFLCLDIGDFSVKALAHRVRGGIIIKSSLKTIESTDTSFAIKSAIDSLENELGSRFESAFITGNFGQADFKTILKKRDWPTPYKITNTDIQNQISEIRGTDNLYPMHIFPLRYDISSVSNLLTPVGKTDKNLISIFGTIFYDKNKTNHILGYLRHAHIQAKTFFDPSYLINLNFRKKKENAIFIDLGASFTSVSLWTDRGPVFFKKDAFGQSEITKKISEKLNISIKDIIKIKNIIASIKPDEMDRFTPADSNYDFSRADLNDIITDELSDIISKTKESIAPSIEKYNPIKIFISGGGSNIPGIKEFIEEAFELPVENLGGYAALQSLSDIIWKSQENKVNKYLRRKNKIENLYSKLFSIFKRKKLRKKLIPIMPSTLSFDMTKPDTYRLFKSSDISIIHVDIMDGFFVDKIAGSVKELKFIRANSDAHLHVHLMTESPNTWAQAVADSGADTIILSTGTAGVRNAIISIKKMGKRCGIALPPETPVSILKPILKDIDEILIMAVRPGAGGQEFELGVLHKISMLANTRRKYDLKYKISVDGGINESTAKLCWHAGADLLVSGSYLARNDDFRLAIQSLMPDTD